MKTFTRSLLLLSLFGLAACNEREVASRLDLSQSTELMVALQRAGIAAERVKDGAGAQASFSVNVDDSQFARALEVVHEYGLVRPAEKASSESNGFVPPSKELALFELDGRMAAQLERLLRGLDGVVDVRAVVRGGAATGSDNPPRVTLLVRYASASGKAPFSEEQVRQIISGILPAIKPDGVSLSTERVVFFGGGVARDGAESPTLERLSPLGFRVPSAERTTAQQQVAGVVILASISALVIGLYSGWIMSTRAMRKRVVKRGNDAVSDNFFLEQARAGEQVVNVVPRPTEGRIE